MIDVPLVATATWREGHADIRLSPPSGQRCVDAGPDHVLLGFPASAGDVPWSRLAPAQQTAWLHAAVRGDRTLAGSWTLVGREGDGLVVRTDQFGTRPLLWRAGEDGVRIADEPWSLLDRPIALDPRGVADFLLLGQHFGSRTIFADVSCTEPDTLLSFESGAVRTQRLSRPIPAQDHPSFHDAVDALAAQLGRLLAPYSDVDALLVPLSGGLDSRVLAAAGAERGHRITAWTYSEGARSPEERIARGVASTLGIPHAVSRPEPIDWQQAAQAFVRETCAQLSLEHVHGYPFLTSTPSDARVAAFGPGGENVCGGALMLPPDLPAQQLVPERARRLALGRDPRTYEARLPGAPGWGAGFLELLDERFAALGRDPRLADLTVVRDRAARFNVWTSKGKQADREYLVPFMDEQVARTCFGLPPAWRYESLAYRRAIARRWPQLAKLPWAKTGLPVARYPRPIGRRVRRVQGRLAGALRAPAVPAAEHGLERLIERAPEALSPALARVGIDLPGLLADHPADSRPGRCLRVRAATLHVAVCVAAEAPPPA